MIEKLTNYSDELQRDVDIYIRLPYNYDEEQSYNVLYMHDGQNLFFKETSAFGMIWDVDTILTTMENSGFEPLIVVGISSNKSHNGYLRLAEYSYYDSSEVYQWIVDANNLSDLAILDNRILVSRGKQYETYLSNTLFSDIETRFKIKKRYMMGSSMGGLFTLSFALRNPNIIEKAFCVSNAFHYNLAGILNDCCSTTTKIYLDVGDNEASQGKTNSEIYINCNKQVYEKLGEFNNQVVFKVIKDGVHNELAWSSRFETILKAL